MPHSPPTPNTPKVLPGPHHTPPKAIVLTLSMCLELVSAVRRQPPWTPKQRLLPDAWQKDWQGVMEVSCTSPSLSDQPVLREEQTPRGAYDTSGYVTVCIHFIRTKIRKEWKGLTVYNYNPPKDYATSPDPQPPTRPSPTHATTPNVPPIHEPQD